jgi:glutaredoxin 1
MEKITIFGRPGCGFCSRAKQLCEIKSFNFTYIDIWKEKITKADLEKTIGRPVQTMPQIFHGKQYIGGFTEFEAFVHSQS